MIWMSVLLSLTWYRLSQNVSDLFKIGTLICGKRLTLTDEMFDILVNITAHERGRINSVLVE